MCPSNTSHRICGIPTSRYLDHPDKSSVKVIFHSSCKGCILWAIASSGLDSELLDIGDGRAHLTEGIDNFLCYLWEANNMAHAGLQVFAETSLAMVVGIAEASVQFSAGSLGQEAWEEWEQDPEKAYQWLKSHMREYQRGVSDIDSDLATAMEDMNPRQRMAIEDKKRAVERHGRVAPPKLKLWLVKHSKLQEWEEVNGKLLEIQEKMRTGSLSTFVRDILVAKGDELKCKSDMLKKEYREAGGQHA